MARNQRFTLRVNRAELQMLRQLASHLKRSRSDAIRFLLGETVKKLSIENGAQSKPENKSQIRKGKTDND